MRIREIGIKLRDGVLRAFDELWPNIRSGTVYALLVSPIAIFIASVLWHNLVGDKSSNLIDVSFQFLFGNWPSWKGTLDPKGALLSFFVAFRFFWVFGTVFALVSLVTRLLAWGKAFTMRYRELLQDRDHMIETQVLQIFPPDEQERYRRKIADAVARGAQLWEDTFLPSAWGPDKADRIKQALTKEAV